MTEVGRRELAELLTALSKAQDRHRPTHRGRWSDGDQDFSSLLEQFRRAIPTLLQLLDCDRVQRQEALLERLHSCKAALERSEEEREVLFSALQDSEKRQQSTLQELRRTQSLAAELESEKQRRKAKAREIKRKLVEDEEKSVRKTEAAMSRNHTGTQLQLSQDNQELRIRLSSSVLRIATLKAKNSYLKLSLSKATQRLSDLETAVASLSDKLLFAEKRNEELDSGLQKSEKKARQLEEELSFHADIYSKDILEDIDTLGDSEKDKSDVSFREEIELSARLTLGDVEEHMATEEELFSPRRQLSRIRVSDDFGIERRSIWQEPKLVVEKRLLEAHIVPRKPEQSKPIWSIAWVVVLWLAVLCVKTLFQASVICIQMRAVRGKRTHV